MQRPDGYSVSVQRLVRFMYDAHNRSRHSIHELSLLTTITPSYIIQVLTGTRIPSRDALVLMCTCGWWLTVNETNDILISAGHTPLSPHQDDVGKLN